jgi:hypothetical protein
MTTIKLDPDDLYQEGSQTFFFVKGKLYIRQYPETHKDMIQSDGDLFEDVWGFGIEDGESRHFSRGVMVNESNAQLGRIGIHSRTGPAIVVAFWKNPSDQMLASFFDALFRKYPMFAEHKSNIMVVRGVPEYGGDGKAQEFAKAMGTEEVHPGKAVTYSPPKELARHPENPYDDKYEIDGQRYSRADMHRFRAGLHIGNRSGMKVLCHPDLDKYPELQGYRPAGCGKLSVASRPPETGPSAWRRAGREQGLPYVYSYGECSFRDWVLYQDIFSV